jgi:phage shock protein PspC (stress-responsive transcriptional regulator)
MLGTCEKLQNKTGIDRFIFQILFVILFFSNPGLSLGLYIVLNLVL